MPDLSVPSPSQVLRSLCLLRAIDIVLKSYNPVSQTPSEDLHKAECFHSLDWISLTKNASSLNFLNGWTTSILRLQLLPYLEKREMLRSRSHVPSVEETLGVGRVATVEFVELCGRPTSHPYKVPLFCHFRRLTSLVAVSTGSKTFPTHLTHNLGFQQSTPKLLHSKHQCITPKLHLHRYNLPVTTDTHRLLFPSFFPPTVLLHSIDVHWLHPSTQQFRPSPQPKHQHIPTMSPIMFEQLHSGELQLRDIGTFILEGRCSNSIQVNVAHMLRGVQKLTYISGTTPTS